MFLNLINLFDIINCFEYMMILKQFIKYKKITHNYPVKFFDDVTSQWTINIAFMCHQLTLLLEYVD